MGFENGEVGVIFIKKSDGHLIPFDGVLSISLEEPEGAMRNIAYPVTLFKEQTFSFCLPRMSRRRFRGLLMKMGASRNQAEHWMKWVASFGGSMSYWGAYFRIVFAGAPFSYAEDGEPHA